MNHTTNYQLSRWERTDKVLMEDFNADNAKIDAALAAQAGTLAAHTEALAGKGNCRIIWGSQQGHSQCGEAYPTSLTFDGKPLAVFVMSTNSGSNTYSAFMPLIRGVQWTKAMTQGYCAVTWTDHGVSWYGSTPQYQMSNAMFYYIALLTADE